MLGLLLVSFLSSCGGGDDDPPEEDGGSGKSSSTPGAKLENLELDASGYNAKRTQAFGFLSRLPADTEGAMGAVNFSDFYKATSGSQTVKSALDMFTGGSVTDQDVANIQQVIDTYVGRELFVAMSAGTADKLGHFKTVFDQVGNYVFGLANAKSVEAGADPNAMLEEIRKPLVAALRDDSSELSKAVAGVECPPLIFGSKMTDGAQDVASWLDSLEDQLPPHVIVSEFEHGDSTFKSMKIHFQDVIADEHKAEINEFFQDEKATDALVEKLRAKKIELTYGVIDSYLIITLGANHDHLKFVSKPEESILAAKRFKFADAYLDKKLVGYAFAHKGLISLTKGKGIAGIAESISEGLSTADSKPPIQKLGAWVKDFGTQLGQLGEGDAQTYLGVTYMEKGLHGESVGGFTSEMADGKSKSYFANMAPADSALVISGSSNAQFREQSTALMETLFSGVEIGVEAYASESGNTGSLDQFKGMKEGFGGHLEKVWGTLQGDFIDGLGSQSGVIVDLNGSLPKIPSVIPKVIANEAKVPRIVLASDVKERKKLADSWEVLKEELNAVAEKIDPDLLLPDTITDENDDVVTHYFPFAFLSNNFIPSLSLNDELFFLSTSKQYSESLAAAAKEAPAGDIRGFYMRVNYTELNKLATHWLDLLAANGEELFTEPGQLDRFAIFEEQARPVLQLLICMKQFTYNRFEGEGSAWRSSWHLHIEE